MNLTTAPDIDLRALPEIARDRSPAGRAQLFAFLAKLLVARWERLSPGERTQLAELIAVLWPRGAGTDRDFLAAHFAGRADIPSALRESLGLAQGLLQAAPVPAAPSPLPSPSQKKHLKITITQQPLVIRRKRANPPAAALTVPPLEILPVGADPESGRSAASDGAEEHLAAERSIAAERVALVTGDASPSEQTAFPVQATIVDGQPGSPAMADSSVDSDSGDTSARPTVPVQMPFPVEIPQHSAAALSRESEAVGYDALLASALLHTAPDIPAGRVVAEDEVTILTPRDNPHRLTIDLLGAALTAGDQARFEVMLASVAGLRSSLLRRLLRDGGDEAFAILARSVGMDEASFTAQWQNWQKNQAELHRAQRPLDGARLKRGGAFFRNLTEQQTGRLVKGWRGRAGRIFSTPRTSS